MYIERTSMLPVNRHQCSGRRPIAVELVALFNSLREEMKIKIELEGEPSPASQVVTATFIRKREKVILN